MQHIQKEFDHSQKRSHSLGLVVNKQVLEVHMRWKVYMPLVGSVENRSGVERGRVHMKSEDLELVEKRNSLDWAELEPYMVVRRGLS